VYTQPDDLAEETLRTALMDGWGCAAATLRYQAVGFGSHHWLATDAAGRQLFLTVDDLPAKLLSATDSADAAFGRLERAFAAALSLRVDCGLQFVAAPIPDRDGRVLVRLQDEYSMVVHQYLLAEQAGPTSLFQIPADQQSLLEALAALHAANPPAPPLADDFAIPGLDELTAAMSQAGQVWDSGPYADRASKLLAVHAADLAKLLRAFDSLAARVDARRDRMVVTHGEPGAHNALRTPSGLVLVDWDSVLLAAPERDLWDLAEHDASVLDAYSAISGGTIDLEALACYRMWYDLFEIAGYIRLFRRRHDDTADTAESWRNLQHFLQPARRWPHLFAATR
jgi:hypothetical protein